MIKTFDIGQTYKTTSIWDSDHWHRITIASRTAKSIRTTDGETLRVIVDNGREIVELTILGYPYIGVDSKDGEARVKAQDEARR